MISQLVDGSVGAHYRRQLLADRVLGPEPHGALGAT